MKTFTLIGAIAITIATTGVTTAVAADKFDLGKHEYDSNCVACHGNNLKGGAYVDFLKVTPPDLTLLSKKNGGVFPLERVYNVIDGRQEVKGHGPRDMPVWGDYFAAEKTGASKSAKEQDVAARIEALVVYLQSLQAK